MYLSSKVGIYTGISATLVSPSWLQCLIVEGSMDPPISGDVCICGADHYCCVFIASIRCPRWLSILYFFSGSRMTLPRDSRDIVPFITSDIRGNLQEDCCIELFGVGGIEAGCFEAFMEEPVVALRGCHFCPFSFFLLEQNIHKFTEENPV